MLKVPYLAVKIFEDLYEHLECTGILLKKRGAEDSFSCSIFFIHFSFYLFFFFSFFFSFFFFSFLSLFL